MTAPVSGSGPWPEWTVRLAKARRFFLVGMTRNPVADFASASSFASRGKGEGGGPPSHHRQPRLIVMRLASVRASAGFGNVSFRTPFLNVASTVFGSTAKGRLMLRENEP